MRIIYCTLLAALCLAGCKQGNRSERAGESETSVHRDPVSMTLFDKTLPEIQEALDGKWKLISGQTATVYFEFDDTFIDFNGDTYVWTDEDGPEPGLLNWRKAPTGSGYDAFVMEVFYEDTPSFPLAIREDTLLIQDIENLYLYKLVRK